MRILLVLLCALGLTFTMPSFADDAESTDTQMTTSQPDDTASAESSNSDSSNAPADVTGNDAKDSHKAKGTEAAAGCGTVGCDL